MVELRDLKEQIVEKDKKIEIFQNNELEFRKKMRELEDQKKNVDLEIVSRLDEEREKSSKMLLKCLQNNTDLKTLRKTKR